MQCYCSMLDSDRIGCNVTIPDWVETEREVTLPFQPLEEEEAVGLSGQHRFHEHQASGMRLVLASRERRL